MDEPRDAAPRSAADGAPHAESTRSAPLCGACGGATRFDGGVSTHDLYAERFVCLTCGHESYRSFGRGSVS